MKVYSDTEPKQIEIDRIEKGIAHVQIRWNVKQVDVPNMDGKETRKGWEYDEELIQWSLPTPGLTPAQIAEYFSTTHKEIEGFAKAKRTDWKRTDAGKIDITVAAAPK